MPQLAPLIPAVAGGGAAATTATAGAGTVVGGLTAAELTTLGAAVVLGAGVLGVKAIVDDHLDIPTSESEIDSIKSKAGEKSKAEQRRIQDCKDCVWCMVNIQAQGTYFPLQKRTDPQGIGPYLVNGRTVYVREGVIIVGETHAFAQGLASRRNFRDVEKWDLLGRTIKYIQSRPPSGLPNGEYRVPGPQSRNTLARYDIMVFGTINAFMS